MERRDEAESHPAKRRAIELEPTRSYNGDQLQGKAAEELVEIIHEMQTNFDNKFVDLNAKYDALNREVTNIKKCIVSFFRDQNAATDAAAQYLVEATANAYPTPNNVAYPTPNNVNHHPPSRTGVAPLLNNQQYPQPALRQQASPLPPMSSGFPPTPAYHRDPTASSANHASPTTSTPFPRPNVVAENRAFTPSRPPAGVPSSTQDNTAFPPVPPSHAENSPASSTMPANIQIIPSDKEGEPPTVIYSNAPDVATVWREFRYGADGLPSLESLEKEWGSGWRPDPRGRTWFSRRKLVHDKIKELLHDGLSEEAAVDELEKVRAGRSMNTLMNILQKDRKETKANWKAAAAAAKATKDASRSESIGQAPLHRFTIPRTLISFQ